MLEVQSIGTQFLGQAVEVFGFLILQILIQSEIASVTVSSKHYRLQIYAGSIRPVKTQDHQERRLIK